MMRNKLVNLLGIAASALSLSVLAGRLVTETAEFSGSAVPSGWTVSNGGCHSADKGVCANDCINELYQKGLPL